MEIKIEKGIPLPNERTKSNYPLEKMGIGDSFFLECTPDKENSLRVKLYSAAKLNQCTVTIRKEKNGIRVWRVK